MSNHYIYFHYKANTDEVFYVGMGTGRRAWRKINRTKHWHRVVNKYGVDVRIIHDNLSVTEAEILEVKYISEFKRIKDGGTLVNVKHGGNCFVPNEVFGVAVGNRRRGQKLTDTWKAKIKENASKYWLGREVPAYIREKIRIANTGKQIGGENPNATPIIQYDKMGNFILEYPSISDARKGKTWSQGNISNCCAGKIPSAYGFVWKYK
jgi:hypothetical protein